MIKKMLFEVLKKALEVAKSVEIKDVKNVISDHQVHFSLHRAFAPSWKHDLLQFLVSNATRCI